MRHTGFPALIAVVFLSAACAEPPAPATGPAPAASPPKSAAPPAVAVLPDEPEVLPVRLVRRGPRTSVSIGIEGAWRVEDAETGDVLRLGRGLDAELEQQDGTLRLEGEDLGSRTVRFVAAVDEHFQLDGTWYPGRVEARPGADGHLVLVNLAPFELYLAGVVASEMPASFPREALRAQAVLARSFALAHLANLTDDPRISQAYAGEGPRTLLGLTASTMGWRLVDGDGHRLPGYWYHSTCGGHTADASTVFDMAAHPAYAGVPCTTCTTSRYYAWESVVPEADLRRALGAGAAVSVMAPDRRTPEGRVLRFRTRLEDGTDGEVQATRLRSAVGVNQIRSTWITNVDRLTGAEGTIVFRFRGRGWGHGVGLCQIGARGLADAGGDAEDILSHYYPGTRLEKRP